MSNVPAVVEPAPQELELPNSPKYAAIRRLEAAIPEVLQEIPIDSLTNHAFCDGVYRREFFLPKGATVVSKIHKKENWFLLWSGDVSIASADGTVKRVQAPYMAKTPINTKRVVYAHADSVMYTFHGNPENETDPEVLETQYILPEHKATLPPAEKRALLERMKQ